MRKMLLQVRGKLRRFVLVHWKKDYVEHQSQLRIGECNQCGNCCEILFKCPFLVHEEEGTSFCSVYHDRPGQCAAFPIDEQCLAEVDFDCTFTFAGSPLEIEAAIDPAKTDEDDPEPDRTAERQKTMRAIPILLLHLLLKRLR